MPIAIEKILFSSPSFNTFFNNSVIPKIGVSKEYATAASTSFMNKDVVTKDSNQSLANKSSLTSSLKKNHACYRTFFRPFRFDSVAC